MSGVIGGAAFKVYDGDTTKVAIAALGSFVVLFALTTLLSPASPPTSSKKKKKKSKKKAVQQEGTAEKAPQAEKKAKKEEPKKSEPTKKESTKAKKAKEPTGPTKKSSKGKKQAAPTPKKTVKTVDSDASDDDEMFFRGPIIADIGAAPSKSSARRARAKENKAATQTATSNKPIVDADGFTTFVVKKRVRKPVQQVQQAVAKQGGQQISSDSITVEIDLSVKHYGLIIGAGGVTLNKIQDSTDCRINIPDKDSEKKTVTISGSKDNVKKCQTVIKSLIEKGFSSITDPGVNSSSIACPGKALGIVIGPGGSNIKKIQTATNTKIATPSRESGSDRVTISGENKADVRRAKDAIKMLVEHGFSEITHDNYTMIIVPFPYDSLRLLVGPGGHTIKSIQGDTKARVNIPDDKIPGTNVDLTVVGTKEAVEKAKKQILKLTVEKEDSYDWVDPHEDDPDYDSQEEYFQR